MNKVLMLLVAGTLVSGMAAFYAGAQVLAPEKTLGQKMERTRR